MWSLRLHERHRFSTSSTVLPFFCGCCLQLWTLQRSIRMAPRIIRFHTDRTDICRTLLCRVHRYLLCSAIMVCLLGHTAVQTLLRRVFWRWRRHAKGPHYRYRFVVLKFSSQDRILQCTVEQISRDADRTDVRVPRQKPATDSRTDLRHPREMTEKKMFRYPAPCLVRQWIRVHASVPRCIWNEFDTFST